MAGSDEVKYLRAFSLDKAGRKDEAVRQYAAISSRTYYGDLARENSGNGVGSALSGAAGDYPVVFRSELLQAANKFRIDPRFLLAIMKQESSFRTGAKSPAGARGLLQLVFDTAIKYKKNAGYPNLQPDQLYSPSINIGVGAAYIADLKSEFGGLNEAIAASYNGGEDNAARWLHRSKPKDPGIFVSEIGFAETKNYVFKVMNNYRLYKGLYT
jgi:soluble lytic murein transglycosylase